MTTWRGPKRAGSAYLVVLGTATMVTVLGLSALLAARVELRGAVLAEDAVRAQAAGASALELALLRVSADHDWRANYTHDVWTTPETLAGISYSYKLVCQADNDLNSKAEHATRLYGKATVGTATRIYSVLIEDMEARIPNAVFNGDMENGATNWETQGWYSVPVCDIAASTDAPHDGMTCLQVTNRDVAWSGPMQEITERLVSGTTYEASAWVRPDASPANASIGLYLETSLGGTYTFAGERNLPAKAWGELTGSFAPTWSGTLQRAYLFVLLPASTQNFGVDDVSLREPLPSSVPAIALVHGSWRREAND